MDTTTTPKPAGKKPFHSRKPKVAQQNQEVQSQEAPRPKGTLSSFLTGLGASYKPVKTETTTTTIGGKVRTTERVSVGKAQANMVLPNAGMSNKALHTVRQFFLLVSEAGLSFSFGYDDERVYIAFWLADCYNLMAYLEKAMMSRPYDLISIATINENGGVVVDGAIVSPGSKENPTSVVFFDERLDVSQLPDGFVNLNPTFKLAQELRRMMAIHQRKTTTSAE